MSTAQKRVDLKYSCEAIIVFVDRTPEKRAWNFSSRTKTDSETRVPEI